jgi:L-threonylcarbamoyladenylate synthase
VRVFVPAARDHLPETDAQAIRTALTAGELLIFPTDTLYALGGLLLTAGVGARIRVAKNREAAKALPAVAADLDQVKQLCDNVSEKAWALARAFWPGPLTLILPAAARVPEDITVGTATIAVRVPGRELTRRLCRLAGPLVSTSANVAGETPAATCAEAVASVGTAASLAIDGGQAEQTQPSTIVDATDSAPRLVRQGAVAWEAITRIWS